MGTAWLSLVVALAPMVEMGQRLIPVQRAVRKGITRISKAGPEQQAVVKAKAWDTALFLFDGPGEAWWWLQIIRPAALKEPPWTDGEDGGVAAAACVVPMQDDQHVDDPALDEARKTDASLQGITTPKSSHGGDPPSLFGDEEEVLNAPASELPVDLGMSTGDEAVGEQPYDDSIVDS